MKNMWWAWTSFIRLFKGSVYKNTQSVDCSIAGKTDGQRFEAVMEEAETYFL